MSDDFYRALEERFRASQAEIRSRLEGYTPFLRALCATVATPKAFDIGCGRGEWLQLLSEWDIQAQGVDLDDSMLAACHERGLNAHNQDALQALQALPDNSLDLITAFHVVEHLTFDYLRALLKEAQRVLSPAGLLILETPNAENLIVGTTNFYLDPTHHRPVPAEFLEFFCQYSGFAQSKIVRLQEDRALHDAQAHIGLWQVIYGVSPDYAVVARKTVPDTNDAFADLFNAHYGLTLHGLAERHNDILLQRFEQQAQQLNQLQQLHQHTDAQLQQLAQEQTALHAQLQQAHTELTNLHHSLSWRITAPLRKVKRLIGGQTVLALKEPLARNISAIIHHPKLVASVRKTTHVLGIEKPARKLLRTWLRSRRTPHPDLALSYSPRVMRQYKQLQKLLSAPAAVSSVPGQRPRLAYVSPMPPDRTGIADYSAELLPALAQYYDITVIVDNHTPHIHTHAGFTLQGPDWLREHASDCHAVLYHMGNSHWHCYMLDLLEDVPGIIMLHDFYLSGLIWHMDIQPGFGGIKVRELQHSHGYKALVELYADERPIAMRYPFNRSILSSATGVLVHSAVSYRLANQWYASHTAANWQQIPLLRELATVTAATRAQARQDLGLAADAFIVCSFGVLGETKLNDRLISAWQDSALAQDSRCQLIFVGELGHDDYCDQLRDRLAQQDAQQIHVTGWADTADFKRYLQAADMAVQLRTHSRGETSGTVLDCMNYSIATIVNANGSMADLPENSVYLLPDEFSTQALTEALQTLWRDPDARQALGQQGRHVIEQQHTPQHCAALYHSAIETFVQQHQRTQQQLVQQLHDSDLTTADTYELYALAEQYTQSSERPAQSQQLLLDITGTFYSDYQSGIERTAKALVLALLKQPPSHVSVEPVYLSDIGGRWHYRYARQFTCQLLGIPDGLQDQAIDYSAGDQLLMLDIAGIRMVSASRAGLYQRMRANGVTCQTMLHDILPLTRPELFPPQADTVFLPWLQHVVNLDGAVCVTQTVAHELQRWLTQHHPARARDFKINYSHHGADLSNAAPSTGLPDNASALLNTLQERPTILMVGTLEPRKGYLQALEAFSLLWQNNIDVNLVIVGRAGWQQLPDEQRSHIPQLLHRLHHHPEKHRRLFWLDGPSDEFLAQIYAHATGLLAASEDEGFGLPLIEAAQHGLPILARDIPVFREVAGPHAAYFNSHDPAALADAIRQWVRSGFTPSSETLPWLTWQQSAANLQQILFNTRD